MSKLSWCVSHISNCHVIQVSVSRNTIRQDKGFRMSNITIVNYDYENYCTRVLNSYLLKIYKIPSFQGKFFLYYMFFFNVCFELTMRYFFNVVLFVRLEIVEEWHPKCMLYGRQPYCFLLMFEPLSKTFLWCSLIFELSLNTTYQENSLWRFSYVY